MGARNAGNTERSIHFLLSTAGQINASFEVDNNIAQLLPDMILANGENIFGAIVWIDKDGDEKIKFGFAQSGSFDEVLDGGGGSPSLAGVTPGNLDISDNVYWGARNDGGSDGTHTQLDIAEVFVQSGMTQADFDAWGARFLSVYDL